MSLRTSLPEFYEKLLPMEFLNLNPQEKHATCGDCYKLKKNSPLPKFNPHTKCCTFYPFIPNYLVGAILVHKDMSYGASVLKKIFQSRKFALPIGVCAPPNYQYYFKHKQIDDFGNREDLICPFYRKKSGECGIWLYRGHECTTYHCVSSYNKKGEEFWHEVSTYLNHIENEISQMAMVEKGYTHKEIQFNLKFIKNEDNIDRRSELSAQEWSGLWVHHVDDIENFYVSTFKFVLENKNKLELLLNESRKRTNPTDPRILATLLMGGAL